jgi:hypothetical protein
MVGVYTHIKLKEHQPSSIITYCLREAIERSESPLAKIFDVFLELASLL